MKPLGLLIPTYWEAAPVIKAFGFRKVDKNLYHSNVRPEGVLLVLSGVGLENARAATHRLCKLGISRVVSVGFCGALVASKHVGDLITDRIATSPVPVRTEAERQALAQKANAVAVDMETQAVIEAATRHGVPIDICRVISDGVGHDLTPIFGDADTAAFSPFRIALRLLNPKAWPLANILRKNSQIAKGKLVDALRQKLQAK